MIFKSLEIFYDLDAVPDLSAVIARPALPRWDEAANALIFRAAAIEIIDAALIEAEIGEWNDAGLDHGTLRIGFSVDDYDIAEEVVRLAVAGTRFSEIREIVRLGDTGPTLH